MTDAVTAAKSAAMTSALPSHVGRRRSYPSGAHVIFEREEVFRAPEGAQLPDLAGLTPGVSAGPAEHHHVVSDYYDTPTLELAAKGITVRYVRSDSGNHWVVSLLLEDWTGAPVEREVRFQLAREPLPNQVRRVLPSTVGRRHLELVAHGCTRSVVVPLLSLGGVRVADVLDQEIVLRRTSGGDKSLREVRVEVVDLAATGRGLIDAVHARLVEADFWPERPRAALDLAFGG